jgi:hypothetical protein
MYPSLHLSVSLFVAFSLLYPGGRGGGGGGGGSSSSGGVSAIPLYYSVPLIVSLPFSLSRSISVYVSLCSCKVMCVFLHRVLILCSFSLYYLSPSIRLSVCLAGCLSVDFVYLSIYVCVPLSLFLVTFRSICVPEYSVLQYKYIYSSRVAIVHDSTAAAATVTRPRVRDSP